MKIMMHSELGEEIHVNQKRFPSPEDLIVLVLLTISILIFSYIID